MTDSAAETIVMTMADSFTPTLYAGKYTLTVTQTLLIEGVPPFTEQKTFHVAAPRFVLAPDEVYSVYPPDGQTGAYHETVPHVVFRRKGLPWERKPWEDATDGTPWMALLVFDESEMTDIQIKSVSFTEAVEAKDGGSGIALDEWERPDAAESADAERRADVKICMVMDLPASKFRAVAPRLGELSRLAHARQVETDDKEDVPGIGDGWFSVLVANRTPAPDHSSFAFVVSLEGWQDMLRDAAPRLVSEKIRLAVLARWSFVSYGPTFQDLLDGLCFDDGRADNNVPATRDMWLRAPPATAGTDKEVETALNLGYVPMRHLLRQGDRAVSWYRGPLTPVPVRAEPTSLIYRNSDEALQFDTNLGLFNVSYAAAWQLGRLLALQAPEFAGALFNWEGNFIADAMVREANQTIEREKLFVQKEVAGTEVDPAWAEELLQDEMMTAIVLEWCLDHNSGPQQ
jgi:hypothetical protein